MSRLFCCAYKNGFTDSTSLTAVQWWDAFGEAA